MAQTLKVRRVGNSLGVLLPQPLLEALQAQEGTELFVVQTPDGVRLTAYDPDFAAAVEDARAFMDSHRNAFRELAK
jgi:putative addiction module antidote